MCLLKSKRQWNDTKMIPLPSVPLPTRKEARTQEEGPLKDRNKLVCNKGGTGPKNIQIFKNTLAGDKQEVRACQN